VGGHQRLRRIPGVESEPRESSRSLFVQSERFSGILVGLAKATLRKTDTGFEQMNAALKDRVEQGGRPETSGQLC
jgi:hypothetical protein